MKTLTLKQVREAGRFAYLPFRESGLGGKPGERGSNVVVWDPSGKRIVHLHVYALWPTMAQNGMSLDMLESGGDDMYGVSPSILGGPQSETGWHHLPGCGCEFCRG